MPQNNLTLTSHELRISLQAPTRDTLYSVKRTVATWNPAGEAIARIKISLTSHHIALSLRDILFMYNLKQLENHALKIELTVFNTTPQILEQLFKVTKAGKRYPDNLSIYCSNTTPKNVWIAAIYQAYDNQLLSEQTAFYLQFPLCSGSRGDLNRRQISFVENYYEPTQWDYYEGPEISQVQISSLNQSFFEPSLRNLELEREIEIERLLIKDSSPLKLDIGFNAPEHKSTISESVIRRAFEDWKLLRQAVLTLSVSQLDEHWGGILKNLLLSDRCLDTFQSRKVIFQIMFQQATEEGLQVFFEPDEKTFPQNISFICDNTTHQSIWFNAIFTAIQQQRFSEFTHFDLGAHRLAPNQSYVLGQLLNSSKSADNLSVTFHVGRCSSRTLTSKTYSLDGTANMSIGYLPTIDENEEERTYSP